jgi:hypothetical protein
MSIAYLWTEAGGGLVKIRLITARRATVSEIHYYTVHRKPMTNQPIDEDMPEDIDFSQATRGRHHIPAEAQVFLPASIERSAWEYFSDKAERKGVGLSQLLTEVLKRDIEINEALK